MMNVERRDRTIFRLAKYISFLRPIVAQGSNLPQKGNTIYREVAKDAKDVKNKRDFSLLQDLQGFLRDLRAFAVPNSRSGLSGLGIGCE